MWEKNSSWWDVGIQHLWRESGISNSPTNTLYPNKSTSGNLPLRYTSNKMKRNRHNFIHGSIICNCKVLEISECPKQDIG